MFRETREGGALNEWLRQVGVADLVVVNKTDLVDELGREEVISAVRGINSACQLITTVRSVVDLDLMLDLHAYDQICERPDKFEVELPFFSYINNIQPVFVTIG